MTNPEINTASQDPSLTGGQTSVDNDLLQNVPAEAIEAFGNETVQEIEARYREAKRLDDLRKAPNPFVNPKRANEIDLSYLGPERESAVINFGTAPRHNDVIKLWATRPDSGRIGIDQFRHLVTQLKEEVKLGTDNTASRAQSVWLAMEGFHRRLDDLERLQGIETEAKTKLIEELLAELHELSDKLPSEATIRTLTNIAAVIEAHADYQQQRFESLRGRHPARLPFRALTIKAMRSTEKNIMKLNDRVTRNTANQATRARDDGSSAYARLVDMLKIQERKVVSAQLDLLAETKSELSVRPEDLSPEKLNVRIISEDYLVDRASAATAQLKTLDPKLFEDLIRNPELRPIFQELSSRTFAEFQQRSKLERAAGFSVQMTEANDIRVGGRRLKPTKHLREPAATADGLESLLKEEENRALIERGIILAILSGRFDSFADTLRRLQSTERDEVLETVEQERADVVRYLREINLPDHMLILEVIIDQYKDQISDVLSEPQVDKIKATLDKFFGREKPTEETKDDANSQAKNLEDVLPPSELIGELDWTVLPYGEEGEQKLEEAAKAIVEEAKKRVARGIDVELDLNRLETLRNLRRVWGTDKCHYERGTLKDRGRVSIDGEDYPDEYIVLVMQQLDTQGNVIMEHAVAESPIARHNALYVFRADAEKSAGFSWREVFSVSKKDAREIGGARPLKHTKGDGRPLVEVLTERVNTLLNCSPEEFHRIRFDGERFWISRHIGSLAAQ